MGKINTNKHTYEPTQNHKVTHIALLTFSSRQYASQQLNRKIAPFAIRNLSRQKKNSSTHSLTNRQLTVLDASIYNGMIILSKLVTLCTPTIPYDSKHQPSMSAEIYKRRLPRIAVCTQMMSTYYLHGVRYARYILPCLHKIQNAVAKL